MDDQMGEDSERILIGSEQKGFDYFVREVKKIIFDVLFVLLKEEEQAEGLLSLYAQTAIDYIQMHTFPFNSSIDFIWKASSFLEIIFAFFNIFNISNYLPRINYMAFIISVYILLFIILLIILDILYVSYSFSKKRFAMMWPLYVLRSVASLVVTVLFLPITETLVSVIECQTDPESGQLTLQLFPEVVCWQGWHLLHALLACLFNFLFICICAIVAYAFFEPRMNSGDRTARQDSTGEIAFIINKVTCQVMFSFLNSDQSWILVLVTFALSIWLFKVYNFDDPFYDNEVRMFYNIVSTYYLWTNTMLLISKILENTSFNGGLIAWIIGLPFISMIMISTKKSRIDTLVRSQMKFRSGEQIQGHLRYVLQLIQNQTKDKNAYMLLIGYIEKHKETCQEEDCPLKAKNKSRKKFLSESEIDEQIRNLIQELDRIFLNGLKKQLKSHTPFSKIDSPTPLNQDFHTPSSVLNDSRTRIKPINNFN